MVHPRDMAQQEVETFLTVLVTVSKGASGTLQQVLQARPKARALLLNSKPPQNLPAATLKRVLVHGHPAHTINVEPHPTSRPEPWRCPCP
jgi:hypothetical protein